VAIVAASVVAGARLMASADDTVAAWSAARELAPGAALTEADLEPRRVRFGDDADLGAYLLVGDDLPADAQVTRAIGAGELVPASALGDRTASGLVQVPLSLDPEQVPPAVGPGSVIDLYVLGEGRPATPTLAAVAVIDAPDPADALVTTGKRQLVVAVPEGDVQAYFEALNATQQPSLTVVRRP
jgi:hypothetical protein